MKWILRYLKGTTGHDIMFDSQLDDPSIVGDVDSDYADDLDDKKSTIGYVFNVGGGPVC